MRGTAITDEGARGRSASQSYRRVDPRFSGIDRLVATNAVSQASSDEGCVKLTEIADDAGRCISAAAIAFDPSHPTAISFCPLRSQRISRVEGRYVRAIQIVWVEAKLHI